MPSYTSFLIPLCFSAALCSVSQAQAADWGACEKAKLRQLDIEQAAHANNRGAAKKARGSRSNKSRASAGRNAGQSAEQIDEWLWKNCREYSYELRNLEQQRM